MLSSSCSYSSATSTARTSGCQLTCLTTACWIVSNKKPFVSAFLGVVVPGPGVGDCDRDSCGEAMICYVYMVGQKYVQRRMRIGSNLTSIQIPERSLTLPKKVTLTTEIISTSINLQYLFTYSSHHSKCQQSHLQLQGPRIQPPLHLQQLQAIQSGPENPPSR